MGTAKVTRCEGVTSTARQCRRMADWAYVGPAPEYRIVRALCAQHDASARGRLLSVPFPWEYAQRVDLRTDPMRAARKLLPYHSPVDIRDL